MGRQREREHSARRGGQLARGSAAGAHARALAAHAGGGHRAVHESRAERARRRRPVARALRREGGRVRARPHVRRAALPNSDADGARTGAQSRASGAPAARTRGRRRARRIPPRPARR